MQYKKIFSVVYKTKSTLQMAYRYVEHKYPNSDPNIDLNFNNDLLYSDISENKYADYVKQYRNKDVIPSKSSKKKVLQKKQSPYTTYFVFFIMILGLAVLWYYNKKPSTQSIVDKYPDMTMSEHDVGNRVTYRN